MPTNLPTTASNGDAQDEQGEDTDARILADLLMVFRITKAILAETVTARNHGLALKAIARLENQLEQRARLRGSMRPDAPLHGTHDEWQTVQATLLEALQPFPDARAAAAKALMAAAREQSDSGQ